MKYVETCVDGGNNWVQDNEGCKHNIGVANKLTAIKESKRANHLNKSEKKEIVTVITVKVYALQIGSSWYYVELTIIYKYNFKSVKKSTITKLFK